MTKPEFKTARCVLRWEDRYLLAVHGGRSRSFSKSRNKWGLPGGHVERNEDGVEAVRRELHEELYIKVEEFVLIGDFYYKGHQHRVYGADINEPIARFDRSELLKISWFPLSSIEQLASDGNLHAGYEADAVSQFDTMARSD
ncbi:MAG: 8-oxo-dGTP pyrophosphatase MutT (NUDIX family) [Candidatus Azotimanducaceae bacterium]